MLNVGTVLSESETFLRSIRFVFHRTFVEDQRRNCTKIVNRFFDRIASNVSLRLRRREYGLVYLRRSIYRLAVQSAPLETGRSIVSFSRGESKKRSIPNTLYASHGSCNEIAQTRTEEVPD